MPTIRQLIQTSPAKANELFAKLAETSGNAVKTLERPPKESEAFASKVSELRKAFQQHVRGERKEFLPAVLKALDDEEAEAVVEKIEGAKAEVEEAKPAEAEQRRAAAREEREKAENVARQEQERVEAVRQAAQ